MQTLIEQLISQLTGNATMFTAFDITMVLRRANPQTNIHHGEVRDTVHNLYTSNAIPGYVRSLHEVETNKPQAFVYHPYGSDVEDYDPNFLSATGSQALSGVDLSLPNSSAPNTHQVGSQPVTVLTPQTWLTRSQTGSRAAPAGNSLPVRPKRSRYAIDNVPKDKFGRIRVPASVLRAAGFNPADKVRVVIDPNLIIVTSATDAYGVGTGKKYVVDQYNNIRVHLKGKFPADKFKMQPNNTRVYITPV